MKSSRMYEPLGFASPLKNHGPQIQPECIKLLMKLYPEYLQEVQEYFQDIARMEIKDVYPPLEIKGMAQEKDGCLVLT